MKENQKKSFDFAADTTKQLITLSTAIITLTVTFSKDIIGTGSEHLKSTLVWAWVVFSISICFGILTLMALTGSLQPINKEKDTKKGKKGGKETPEQQAQKATEEAEKSKATAERLDGIKAVVDVAAAKGISITIEAQEIDTFSINGGSIRFFAGLQIATFIAGIIWSVVFGKGLLIKDTHINHKTDYKIIRETKLGIDSTKYIDTVYLPKQ